jgi:kumamolisin
VPDVAGDADPATGYSVRVDGQDLVIGGTSAVAPLWAGLVARLNHGLGTPVGFVHGRLYAAAAATTFRDITSGNNGAYTAGPGWDACTGLGSPNGAALLAALQAGAGPAPAGGGA